jgi:AcrR family transcriptional regulator
MARPRSDIQPRIVHAARARFLEEGVDGASLRTIAKDAETNVGMVFYYFPTKEDLFLAVVEEVYGRLLADLAEALSGDGPVRGRMERVFARLGEASDDELDVVRLVVREVLLSSERFKRVFARMQRGHLKMLLETLGEGVSRGEIDPGVPAPLLLVASLAIGAAPQLARRAAGREAPFQGLPPPDELARASAELLFRAIGPRSESPRLESITESPSRTPRPPIRSHPDRRAPPHPGSRTPRAKGSPGATHSRKGRGERA